MAEKVGVALVADDAAAYFKTLHAVNEATEALVKGTRSAAAALGILEAQEDDAAKGAKGLGADSKKGADGLSILERATKGATERLGHLAVDGFMQASRAVLQWVGDGIGAAADFADGMNNFAAVTGESLEEGGQELEDFSDLFLQLGRELPVSTAEVQKAAIEMAKGGIEPATIAAGGLEQTLKFAGAAGLDLAKAAEIAAKTVGGWAAVNATADEKAALLAHSTDLLARAANASTVDVDELALGLYNVQGTARATGVSLDETVTTLALMSPSFNSSAEAGNAMKNMLLRLQPATEPAAAAMAELGLLTEDGNSAFYDAEGNFIGMRAAAAKLQGSLGGLSEAQKTQALRTIFGNDALNAANILIEQGAEGYDQMVASLGKQLSVADQARLKQQGFNTALDNLGGSLEALQITLFSQGLPALTALVNLIASGVNVISDYAAATAEGTTALSTLISVVSDGALPALIGLTAALTAYGIVQAATSGPALIAFIINLQGLTAAFVANAMAVAAAVAPYALIAAAVAGVAYAWDQFNDKVQTATQELLNSKPFWTESAAALDELGRASDATQERLQPLADSIQEQRDLLESNIESLGRRMAAGFVTEAQYNAEMEAINAQASAIDFASDSLHGMIQAELDAATAGMTATAQAAELEAGTAELGTQVNLTAEDIEDLAKRIQDTYQKGAEAVSAYASTQSSFLSGVETRQAEYAAKIEELEAKKNDAVTADQKQALDEQIKQVTQSYRDQESAAATSYAAQQAEQRAHLGLLLIDYTVAQATLGNISKEKAAEVTGALEKAYGLQESSTASTFLKMAGSIDTFAAEADADIGGLITTLADQQQQAADTQKQMDAYAKTYTADAVANFVDRQGEAEDYIEALESIPEEVQSTLELPAIQARQAEIDDIDGGLRRIPKDVVIRIRVKDEVPPEYKPGSPTPFEMGIRGIIKALGDLSKSTISLPGVTSELGDIAEGVDETFQDSQAPDEANALGENILIGLAEGMADNIARAVRAGRDAVREVIEEMEDEAESDSPSEATARLGGYLDDGLALGMVRRRPALLQAAAGVSNALIDQFSTALDIHSPPDWSINMGEDSMLGLMQGFDNLAPALMEQVGGIVREMESQISEATADGNDELASELEDTMNTLVSAVEDYASQISDALAGSYDAIGDINRSLADNLSSMDDFDGELRTRTQGELDQAEAEAAELDDPREAAAYYALRKDQIMELAQLQQDANDAIWKEAEKVQAEHEKITGDLDKQQTAAQSDRDKDLAKLNDQLLAATTDEERAAIQAQIDARQIAYGKEIDLINQARAAEDARHKQAVAQQQYDSAEMYRRYQAQIELIKKAQEAERKAFEERQSQNSSVQDLINTVQEILNNVSTDADTPPGVFQALYALLAKLNSISGRAEGGAMRAMQPYLVGERGPEIIMPGVQSLALSNRESRAAMVPLGSGGSSYHGGTLNLGGITINGSGLSAGALRAAIYGAVNDVANSADLRLRMGVA